MKQGNVTRYTTRSMFKMLFTLALRCIWIISSGLVTMK